MKATKQCYGCKEQFKREELVDYASANAKILHPYCPKCLKEKQDREAFSNKVCAIFGIKSPGGRIWAERKRLIDNYGYTDNTIINCLEYIYNVEKKNKWSESLCLVNPTNVEKAEQWKKIQENKAMRLVHAAAMAENMKEYVVPVQKSKINKKEILNADDFLDK